MDEVLRHPSYRTLWLGDNLGFVKGNNAALRTILDVWKCDSPYAVMLNNDVEVTHGWLDRMIAVANAAPEVHAVGAVTSECQSWQSYQNIGTVFDVFDLPDGFQEANLKSRAEKLAYCYGELYRKCNMVAFFCTLFKKSVFRKVGYLDERFGVGYGDDDDFCRRLNDAEMRCAVSLGTYVFHNHRATFKALYTGEQIRDMKAERHNTFWEKHGEKATVHAVKE
jgi:GT2 family glycosyltransferase